MKIKCHLPLYYMHTVLDKNILLHDSAIKNDLFFIIRRH